MPQSAKEREQERRARARLRVLHHWEHVTRNISPDVSVLRDLPHHLLPVAPPVPAGLPALRAPCGMVIGVTNTTRIRPHPTWSP
jgi:hypothetical protein